MTIPLYNDKYGKKTIFDGQKLIKFKQDVGIIPDFNCPKYVIITYQKSVVNYFKKKFRIKEIQGLFGTLYLLKNSNGKIGIFLVSGIGAPVTVSVMEDLRALGGEGFIIIDMAGSISPEVQIGDIVICNRAIRDEGTSHHYKPHTKYASASEELKSILSRLLEEKQVKFHIGTSWSTDAPYKETLEEIKQYQAEGVLTVEMAISASFTFGQVYDLPVLGIFVISDNISSLVWEPEYDHKKIIRDLDTVCSTALDSFSFLKTEPN